MSAWLRPNKKMAKIAYTILSTPKDLRQKNDPRPSDKRTESWKINSGFAG